MKRNTFKLLKIAVVCAIAIFLFLGVNLGFESKTAYADDEISVWDGTSDTSWYSNPDLTEYHITSAAGIAGFRDLVNGGNTFEGKTIYLDKDINLDGCKEYEVYTHERTSLSAIRFLDTEAHREWTPIAGFNGVFDGQNHTIYNLSVCEGTASKKDKNRGFFASVSSAAQVKNISFAQAIVSGSSFVGVAIGKVDASAVIQNIVVSDSTMFSSVGTIGAIAGEAPAATDCVVRRVTINCANGANTKIGGIIGGGNNSTIGKLTLTDCEVYDFEIANCDTKTYSGLFAGGDQEVVLSGCKTNSEMALGTGDFTVTGGDSVVHQEDPTASSSIDAELQAAIDEFKTDAGNLGGANLVADASDLYDRYLAMLEGKSNEELEYINEQLDGYLDFASEIATEIASVANFTYGDQTASATLMMIDGSTANATVNVTAYNLVGTLSASVSVQKTYSGTNYTLNATATDITRKAITVQIADKTSVYGDEPCTLTCSASGLVSGDLFEDFVTLTKANGTDVGTYDITGLSNHLGYNVTFENGTYTITARPITISIDDKQSVYGDDIDALTATLTSGTLKSGDALLSVLTLQKAVGNNVGDYVITLATSNSNYNVNVAKTGVYTIKKRAITVVIANIATTYGDEEAELSAELKTGSSLANGDNLAQVITLSRAEGNAVGSYKINFATVSDNYIVQADADAFYTISPKAIVVTINDCASVYGDALAVPTVSVADGTLVAGDTLNGVASCEIVFNDDGAVVGEHSIVGTALSGNYSVTFSGGKYTITKRNIKIVVDDKESVYGDNLATLSCRLADGYTLASGDELADVVNLASTANNAVVNSYDIVATLTNENYALLNTSEELCGTYTVTPRPIAIAVDDKTSVFGDALVTLTAKLTGGTLVEGDTLESILSLEKAEGVNAGEYAINGGCLNLNYAATITAGKYTITKKDASERIVFGVENGAQVLQGEEIECFIDITGVQLETVLTFDDETVLTTDAVGEYTLLATIVDGNYFGNKRISFTTYASVAEKMQTLSGLIATYNSTTATDEERINALFSAQNLYSNLTDTDLMQVEASAEYTKTAGDFVAVWNGVAQGATEDLLVAEKTYDNTLAIVLTAVSAAACLGFIAIKSLVG